MTDLLTRPTDPPPAAAPHTPADVHELAARAEDDVRSWAAGYDPAVPAWTARFPYGPVLDVARRTGRNALALGLREGLREVRAGLPVRSGGAEGHDDDLLLRAWLPMTFDVDEGDYDSYIGSAVLATLHEQHREWSSGEVFDTTAVALLADLVEGELAALGDDVPDRARERRVRAVTGALAGWAELAPRARNAPAGRLTGAGTALPADTGDLLGVARRLAGAVASRTDRRTAAAVRCSFVPTTTEHDELMFIRTIQVFECLYAQVARMLDNAVDAVAAGASPAAADELRCASTRLRATGGLFRIVTTMPRPAFAVIRGATSGRSALQSRAFRRVEQLCGHPVLASGDRGVQSGLAELDAAWTAMKKTHWGIALKIIGRVPGTGGTAGADFLRERAERPLTAAGRAAASA